MNVIHRYPAAPLGRTTIIAPADSRVASVVPGEKGWNIYLEHLLPDESTPMKAFEFACIKTGVPFPAGAKHHGTVRGGFHLISMTAEEAKAYDAIYLTNQDMEAAATE